MMDIGDAALLDYIDREGRAQENYENELEYRAYHEDEWLRRPGTDGFFLDDYVYAEDLAICSHDLLTMDDEHYNPQTKQWEPCADYGEEDD